MYPNVLDMGKIGVLLTLLVTFLCTATSRAQERSDAVARERAVDYFYLQAISLLEQDSVDACFEMLEHCRALAPESSAVLFSAVIHHL